MLRSQCGHIVFHNICASPHAYYCPCGMGGEVLLLGTARKNCKIARTQHEGQPLHMAIISAPQLLPKGLQRMDRQGHKQRKLSS